MGYLLVRTPGRTPGRGLHDRGGSRPPSARGRLCWTSFIDPVSGS